jgi:hypothetical protein
MKKYIAIFLILFSAYANAQHSTPRQGAGPNNDNTGRTYVMKYMTVPDTVGSDTTWLNLNANSTMITGTLKDTIYIGFSSVKNCYLADNVNFLFTNTATGQFVKFLSPNILFNGSDSIIMLNTFKKATTGFSFDGTEWLQQGVSVY